MAILLVFSNSINAIEKHKPHIVHTIEIISFEFVPSNLILSRGDKVVWINRDSIPHNIVNRENDVTLSSTLAKGDKFSYIIKQDLDYACGFHPSMLGKIQIK